MTVKLWYETSLSSGAPRPYSLRPINITSFATIRQPVGVGGFGLGSFPLYTFSAQVPNPKTYP
jgi:hypothetical protein